MKEIVKKTVIRVEGLSKRYGQTVAVDDLSFAVKQGEIFGILGPNGAGKTTAVEMVIGLRRPDRGQISVLGLDPLTATGTLRQRIGVQLQEAALPDMLKVWEALDLFSTFYHRSVDWRPLLETWGLAEKRNTCFSNLSGGQKQRLFIALALINDPEIVFLDELTTGLDPQARRNTWDLVRAIRDQGKTVILVTHFMDEAELLCDRLAIIDRGRVVALDTPQALINHIQPENCVHFTTQNGFDPANLETLPEVSRVVRQGQAVAVYGQGPLLARVATALAERNIAPLDLRQERATLEVVFLALTGRALRD
jgi:ABC-2 type transport system ATP-binding protein